MKGFVIALSGLGLLGLSAESVFAKSGGGSDSPPPPVHHSSSTPIAAPIGNSLPHNAAGSGGGPRNLSGTGSFRPVAVSGKGQQTLVYPGVRNSTIHPAIKPNLNTIQGGALKGGSKLGSQSRAGLVTKTKLDPQASVRLRNWHGNVSSAAQAQAIHAANCHHHHDHDWWRHHCVAFIFFDWGWWAWDDGWWYPAWGYDSSSYYEYNQPIYGDVSPEQIVAGVQARLQELNYYTYSIDGRMGPLTQAALARYQRDHHMNITSGLDPATLNSLSIIR